MATDRSLATLLRALHSPSSDQDASRYLCSLPFTACVDADIFAGFWALLLLF